MSNLSKIEIDAFLMKNLSLESPPVGISLLKSVLPENIEKPEREYTFCEVVEQSRKKRQVIGITKDHIDCPFALEILGLKQFSWERASEIIKSKQFGPHTLKFIKTSEFFSNFKFFRDNSVIVIKNFSDSHLTIK